MHRVRACNMWISSLIMETHIKATYWMEWDMVQVYQFGRMGKSILDQDCTRNYLASANFGLLLLLPTTIMRVSFLMIFKMDKEKWLTWKIMQPMKESSKMENLMVLESLCGPTAPPTRDNFRTGWSMARGQWSIQMEQLSLAIS